MMRRLLEKERLWFWLYIGTNVAAVVVGGIYAALLLLANPFSPITLLLLGIIWLLDIYSFLYLLYRLLYLWRGTPKRIRWTVFCLFTIIWNWVPDASAGSPLYLVHGLISIVSMILSIACLVHDYGVITGAVEQYIPGEENGAVDSGDGN